MTIAIYGGSMYKLLEMMKQGWHDGNLKMSLNIKSGWSKWRGEERTKNPRLIWTAGHQRPKKCRDFSQFTRLYQNPDQKPMQK